MIPHERSASRSTPPSTGFGPCDGAGVGWLVLAGRGGAGSVLRTIRAIDQGQAAQGSSGGARIVVVWRSTAQVPILPRCLPSGSDVMVAASDARESGAAIRTGVECWNDAGWPSPDWWGVLGAGQRPVRAGTWGHHARSWACTDPTTMAILPGLLERGGTRGGSGALAGLVRPRGTLVRADAMDAWRASERLSSSQDPASADAEGMSCVPVAWRWGASIARAGGRVVRCPSLLLRSPLRGVVSAGRTRQERARRLLGLLRGVHRYAPCSAALAPGQVLERILRGTLLTADRWMDEVSMAAWADTIRERLSRYPRDPLPIRAWEDMIGATGVRRALHCQLEARPDVRRVAIVDDDGFGWIVADAVRDAGLELVAPSHAPDAVLIGAMAPARSARAFMRRSAHRPGHAPALLSSWLPDVMEARVADRATEPAVDASRAHAA